MLSTFRYVRKDLTHLCSRKSQKSWIASINIYGGLRDCRPVLFFFWADGF